MNALTRSQIFAPYASVLSTKEQQTITKSTIDPQVEVLNHAIKYNPLVIDANKQYENNHNGETDGILVNANQKDSFNLESSIYKEDKQKQKSLSPLKMMFKNNKDKDNKNQLDTSKDPTTFTFNESLIKQVEEIGYNRDYIITCLKNNESNYCTASYFLLMKQFDN